MLAFVVALRQIAALRRVKANQSIDDALALYRVAVDHLDDGFGRRIGTNNDWFGWWILGTALRLAIYLATLVWPISMPSLIFAADVEGSFGELIWTLLSCSSGQLRRDPCSITSSARASSPCDSSSPSALAVFPEMAGRLVQPSLEDQGIDLFRNRSKKAAARTQSAYGSALA